MNRNPYLNEDYTIHYDENDMQKWAKSGSVPRRNLSAWFVPKKYKIQYQYDKNGFATKMFATVTFVEYNDFGEPVSPRVHYIYNFQINDSIDGYFGRKIIRDVKYSVKNSTSRYMYYLNFVPEAIAYDAANDSYEINMKNICVKEQEGL